ncbi:MAG: hypothetical protein J0I06_22100 [Planctomycetes bacterium]|nr:hypothetical protein [Planctomycetota bacterium]
MNPPIALAPNTERLKALAVQPNSAELRIAELDELLADDDRWLGQFEDVYEKACAKFDEGGDAGEVVLLLWGTACDRMSAYQSLINDARTNARGQFRRRFIAAVTLRMERLVELMRTMVVVWQELELETPDAIYEAVWTIRIPVVAQLRAMWNLFWSSILHPRSETTIELKTGRVLAAD